MKLYLASNSRTRKDILNKVGIKYSVFPSNVLEEASGSTNEEYLINISKLKANAIKNQLDEGVILAADSMICFEGKRLGKPKDREEAKANLKMLSGKVNQT